MDSNIEASLEQQGWTVECESPLEIRHEDGSFASENAAQIVIDYLTSYCLTTENPCGTDTWVQGYVCPCPNCRRYVKFH